VSRFRPDLDLRINLSETTRWKSRLAPAGPSFEPAIAGSKSD